MLKRIVLIGSVTVINMGCTTQEPTSGAQGPSGATVSARATATAPATAEPAIGMPTAAEIASMSFLAKPKPPAANDQCAAVPKGPESPLRQLAMVVRRLACEPALFYESGAGLRKKVALPPDYEIDFSGPTAVSIRVPGSPKAADLAAAMGIAKPVAQRSNSGAWSWRIWHLGSNADTGAFDLWGPGKVWIDVDVAYSELDDSVKVTPIKDEAVGGTINVGMPPEVIPLEHDDVALRMLVAGLQRFAKNRSLVKKDPAEVAKILGLDDDRFRLSPRSSGGIQTAIDIWTRRTLIEGKAVIEALGLKGKIEQRKATDSNDYLLYRGRKGTHDWKGLSLEPSFDKRKRHGAAQPGYELDGITVE